MQGEGAVSCLRGYSPAIIGLQHVIWLTQNMEGEIVGQLIWVEGKLTRVDVYACCSNSSPAAFRISSPAKGRERKRTHPPWLLAL